METLVELNQEREVLDMAGKFMKVKRIVIPFITLVIMTSQLAGCATMSSDEMLKSMQESPDVSIEYAIPDTGQQSLDASGVINVGDTQFVSDSDSEGDIGVIANQQEATELSGAELEEYFQLAYDSGASIEGDLETRIQGELGILISLVDADEAIKLPDNYEQAYRDWRPAEQVQLFEDCNETVYATGTVNIRASYTADSEKLGSLNKGDSVTRTGTAIAGTEAEGWSRIQLSDGSIVYVSNKYLSTSKPSTGGGNTQNRPSGGQQQTQPSGGGQQQTPTDPQGPTPGYNPWENDDSNVVIDTRTEEQKQADLEETRRASEAVTGTIQAGGLGN